MALVEDDDARQSNQEYRIHRDGGGSVAVYPFLKQDAQAAALEIRDDDDDLVTVQEVSLPPQSVYTAGEVPRLTHLYTFDDTAVIQDCEGPYIFIRSDESNGHGLTVCFCNQSGGVLHTISAEPQALDRDVRPEARPA